MPASVLLITANSSALSSHIRATLALSPRSTTKPESAEGVPVVSFDKINNGS